MWSLVIVQEVQAEHKKKNSISLNIKIFFPFYVEETNVVSCYCSRGASREQEPQLTRASF